MTGRKYCANHIILAIKVIVLIKLPDSNHSRGADNPKIGPSKKLQYELQLKLELVFTFLCLNTSKYQYFVTLGKTVSHTSH